MTRGGQGKQPVCGRGTLATPSGATRCPFSGKRAQEVSTRLEQLAAEYDLSLTGTDIPFLNVHDGELFDRIVAHGWLGLAESYMLGQWDAEPLPEVLEVLLQQDLEGRFGAFLSRKRKHDTFGGLPGKCRMDSWNSMPERPVLWGQRFSNRRREQRRLNRSLFLSLQSLRRRPTSLWI